MSVFYFNRLPVVGPWGGGNKTLTSLVNRLRQMGHSVVGEMTEEVDVVFCVDPRPTSSGNTYQNIFDFTSRKKIPLIQRVGDVGTHGKPDLTQLVRMTTSLSCKVIFTSEWARDYIGCKRGSTVIPNGAMPIFYEGRKDQRSLPARPRVVTHHWSNNPLKGIKNYERLYRETMSGALPFDFFYIGRSSDSLSECTFAPVDADVLSRVLPNFDVYLSASLFEAGANHIVEAMACGLPVVYSREGGSIPEYCGGRGVSFETYDEMVRAIFCALDQHDEMTKQSLTYTRTMDDVIDEYVSVLCEG